MPEDTLVIAIKIQNNNHNTLAKVIGQFSNGLITDNTWKCSPQYTTNWNKIYFDDSQWPPAAESLDIINGTNDLVSNEKQNSFGGAKWIHSNEIYVRNNVTYCRKHLSKSFNLIRES